MMKLLPSFLCILSIARAQKICTDENERYTTCASSTCFEETCVDVLFAKPGPKMCTRDCRRGCQCKPGYFRNHDKRCVTETTCVMCGYNEDWVEGDPGQDIVEKTCDDIGQPEDTLEISPFVPGCHCVKDHYRRTEDGLCVSEEACAQCEANEVFETCGSSSCWEYTCAQKDIPLRDRLRRPCTLDCRQGCKCHFGFYRDENTMGCVSAEMCS